MNPQAHPLRKKISDALLSVPIRAKMVGIIVLPVLILGLALNYWVRTGLSDWLSYLLSDDRVSIALEAGSRSVIFITILAAAASILLTYFLALIITHPLLELRRTAKRVAAGRLTSRAQVWSDDEVGEVTRAMNDMIDALVSSQDKLTRANQRLEAMNRVAMAAGRELSMPVVLKAALAGMLEILDLKCGWVYLSEPDSRQFELVCYQGVDPQELALRAGPDNPATCACQTDLLSGELGSSVVWRKCSRAAAQDVYHITIPIAARGQHFGVINLQSQAGSDLSVEDMELLNAIGGQTSEIVINAWLHTRVVKKEADRQALLSALVRAQEDERARIARELHDGIGQNLTSLLIRLKNLEKQVKNRSVTTVIDALCENVSGTIKQVQEISYNLRPTALEEFGLEVALETLLHEMTADTGLKVEYCSTLEDVTLPIETQVILYRIAQECLTNVIRHAHARHVLVELLSTPYDICLNMEDDGRGFDADSGRNEKNRKWLGLIGMQERAEILGGSLEVNSIPGKGTSVRVRIPLEANQSS